MGIDTIDDTISYAQGLAHRGLDSQESQHIPEDETNLHVVGCHNYELPVFRGPIVCKKTFFLL